MHLTIEHSLESGKTKIGAGDINPFPFAHIGNCYGDGLDPSAKSGVFAYTDLWPSCGRQSLGLPSPFVEILALGTGTAEDRETSAITSNLGEAYCWSTILHSNIAPRTGDGCFSGWVGRGSLSYPVTILEGMGVGCRFTTSPPATTLANPGLPAGVDLAMSFEILLLVIFFESDPVYIKMKAESWAIYSPACRAPE